MAPSISLSMSLSTSALCTALVAGGLASAATPTQAGGTLEGFASLRADTYAFGPTSGHFVASANGQRMPRARMQPVQGFSGVIRGRAPGTYYIAADNGFGTKANSPDVMLAVHAVRPDFREWVNGRIIGRGVVVPVEFRSGLELFMFGEVSSVLLHDSDRLLGFAHVGDMDAYPYSGSGPGRAGIPVAKSIRNSDALTGGDLAIESIRRDKNGHLWFGDDFGPFLVKTDGNGAVLRSEIAMPGVTSPSNPHLAGKPPTLQDVSGIQGLAINDAGDTLFTLLGGTVEGDAPRSLRISAFSVDKEQYTGEVWHYRLDAQGTNIGDMVAVNDHQFLVIERNGTEADRFKKVFMIDLDAVDAEGFVAKTEVVDLMRLADPYDLNGDGRTRFSFPFATIDGLLLLDASTLIVVNDNGYPGSSRTPGVPDPTEFLKIHLDTPLPVSAAALR